MPYPMTRLCFGVWGEEFNFHLYSMRSCCGYNRRLSRHNSLSLRCISAAMRCIEQRARLSIGTRPRTQLFTQLARTPTSRVAAEVCLYRSAAVVETNASAIRWHLRRHNLFEMNCLEPQACWVGSIKSPRTACTIALID